MTEPNYATKINLSDNAYSMVLNFLIPKVVESDSDWGKSELNYKGGLYYLDKSHMSVVRISPRRLFGLMNRKIELSDKVDKDTINMIKQIIKFS
jgi:hypothetical protein